MSDRQTVLNRALNDALTDFLRDYPDTSIAEIWRAFDDAKADAATIHSQEAAA